MPPLRAHVLDRAQLLSPATARELERELGELERVTGHQVVVHVTPSLEGLEIEDYSMQLAEAWKVGQKGLDNGVILTIAPNERRVRIEVGYGLEGVLPDAIASRILREQITPAFAAGRMDEGVVAGVRAIEAVIRGEVLPQPYRREAPRGSGWATLVLLAIVVLIVLSSSAGPPGMGRRRRGGWGAPIFVPGGGGYGRGSFGGGFSGGGGGFGGGGASGRW